MQGIRVFVGFQVANDQVIGGRMDREKLLNDIVVRNACARRGEEIMRAVTAYGLRDISENSFIGTLQFIFRSERDHLTKAEAEMIAAAEEILVAPV